MLRKESTSSQNAPTFTCIVCSKEKELVSVGLCDHRRVCSYCAMKSRLHYDYKKCPVCLKILDIIFICEFTDKTPYNTLIKKKDEFYEDEEFDKCGIYYTTIEGKEEALRLRGFNCPIKNCHSESFENINSLQEHLNKVHKRFYCSFCLKENKLFLSQMNIYNQSNLNDHIKYGEYDKNNNLISPPHPSCPFDGSTFYNDEQLFSHMNSSHFICQLCRDKKNIIFYPELKNLLAHYKDNHYCCPFQECLADVYVVFTKEEELVSHLITKHKVQNANERLNKLIFDKKDSDKELCHETGEFNFTDYIKNLKDESLNYKNNNKNRFISLNEQYLNDEGIEVEYRYENSNNNYKNYNHNKYNNNYNNKYDVYNYKNRYNGNDNRGRGGKNYRRGNKNNYNNSNRFNYYNDNYDNNWYNKNNYGNKYNNRNNNYYQNSELHNIEEEVNNNTNNINSNNDNTNNNDINNNQNYIKNEQRYSKGKYYHKEGEDKNKFKKNKIDYSFLFSYYLNIIKEIIKNKIISEKIEEKNVFLPKETIYQIIVMIDKFETNDKLLELTYLSNFGIDLEIHKKLREAIALATVDNVAIFKKSVEKLELKKLLIIYEYLFICSKRVDNLFYRLDLDQIDEDLYEDFCEREKKEDVILDKFEKERRNRKAFLKAELNIGNKLLPEDKNVSDAYKKEDKKEEKREDKKEEKEKVNKPKTKLSMLLNNEIVENEEENENDDNTKSKKGKGRKKKGKGQFVEFNINDYNLEKDFPKLK